MKLENIRECVDLADTLSFTKTAERFFMTQSLLSKHIAAIEKELGVELFLRDRRSVEITQAGRVFVKNARQILEIADNMMTQLGELANQSQDNLSVGFLAGASRLFLADAYVLFREKHPEVKVTFKTLKIQEMVDALEDGSIDLAIGLSLFDLKQSFRTKTIFRNKYCVVVSPGHPFANRETISLEDLKGRKLYALKDNIYPQESRLVQRFLDEQGNDLNLLLELNDIEELPLVLSDDESVGLSMEHIDSYFGDLVRLIPLEGKAPEALVVAIWDERKRLENDAIGWFCDAIIECVDDSNLLSDEDK